MGQPIAASATRPPRQRTASALPLRSSAPSAARSVSLRRPRCDAQQLQPGQLRTWQTTGQTTNSDAEFVTQPLQQRACRSRAALLAICTALTQPPVECAGAVRQARRGDAPDLGRALEVVRACRDGGGHGGGGKLVLPVSTTHTWARRRQTFGTSRSGAAGTCGLDGIWRRVCDPVARCSCRAATRGETCVSI